MYKRVVKGESRERVRAEATEKYKAELVLIANKAKDAYILRQSDLTLITERGCQNRPMSDWLADVQKIRADVERLEAEYKAKLLDVEQACSTDKFRAYMMNYNYITHFTEDDYETVKMANKYGIVEDD